MKSPVLALTLLLSACDVENATHDKSGSDWNDMTWTESVEINPGEVIEVSRHVRFFQRYAAGIQTMGAAYFTTASIEIPSANPAFMKWEAPIRPIYLGRDPETGEWLVVGTWETEDFWFFNGKPCPPQWAFRLHEGKWFLEPIPRTLLGRVPNLLVDLHVTDDRDFTPETFEQVVASRKAKQNVERKPPINVESVGAMGLMSSCTGLEPQFTGTFVVEGADWPNLGNFPRTPVP